MDRARVEQRAFDERRLGAVAAEERPTLEIRPHIAAAAPSVAWDVLALAGLTLAALGIRLLAMRGLWLDEAIAVHETSLPFDEMLNALRTSDRHPPLYFVALWADVRELGTSELAVRLPSLIAGSLVVPALYAAGRELWGRATGLVAATLGTVAPLVVWYAQEARMYAFFMLFSVLCVWAQAGAIRRETGLAWTAYVVSAALLLWTHYFAVLQVAVQLLTFDIVAWRRQRRGEPSGRLLAGSFVSLLLLACVAFPMLLLAGDQLAAAGHRGFSLSDPLPAQVSLAPSQADHLSIYRVVANGTWAVWGYHTGAVMSKLGALWPFAMLLSLVLVGRRCSQSTGLVLAVALAPPLLLAALSLAHPELFEVRYFAGAVPLLVLLLARATTAWSRTWAGTAIAASVVLLTLVVGLADQQLSGSNPRRYDFRSPLQAIEREAGPQDILVYAPRYLRDVVSYYAPDVRRRALRNGLPPLPRHRRVFLVASFLDHPSVARRTGKAVWQLKHLDHLVGHIERHKVSTWVFR